LISDPADFETWLSGSPDEAFKPARSFAAEQMRIMQSGAERVFNLTARVSAAALDTLCYDDQKKMASGAPCTCRARRCP
jgi:hypothetical protein